MARIKKYNRSSLDQRCQKIMKESEVAKIANAPKIFRIEGKLDYSIGNEVINMFFNNDDLREWFKSKR